MLVNHNIIDNLCEDAGEQRKQKAQTSFFLLFSSPL